MPYQARRSPCSSKSAVAGQATSRTSSTKQPVTVHGILANQGSGLGLIELELWRPGWAVLGRLRRLRRSPRRR